MDGSFLKFLSPDDLSDEAIANFKNFGIETTIRDIIDFKYIAEVYYNNEFKSE